jgi:phosphopantetheine--protein transferase-like protein
VLAGYLGVDPGAVRFVAGPHGKPAAVGAGTSIDWNLSHSDELAVIVVARGAQVGVDVERLRPLARVDALARLVCSAAEVAALGALPASERSDAFLRLWSRKEALAKATGAGLGGLARPDPRLRVSDLPAIDGYVGAVATRRSGTPLDAAASVWGSSSSPSASASRVRWLKIPTTCVTSRMASSLKPSSRSGSQSAGAMLVG